jgi:predicted methyltransferase
MILTRIACALAIAATSALPSAAQIARNAPDGGLPPRDEWQRVPEILAALRAAPGQRLADIAAGDGYLTKPLALAVGTSGRVFAVEISEEARGKLAKLAQRESLTNIEIVAGTESSPQLPADIDGAVILNSYHELTDYRSMLAGIRKALKPGGLLVLVDNLAPAGWFTERADQASHHAIEPKFVEAELLAAGFQMVDRNDDFIVRPYQQWLIVARRPVR